MTAVATKQGMSRIGLIGYGGIARDALGALRAAGAGDLVAGVLARSGRTDAARAALGDVAVVETLDALLALRPSLIAEVAGQQAIAEHGEAVLRAGVDLLVISIGALAEPALLERLKAAARDGQSRMLLPAGAIGGIDALAAMRLSGLISVRYRSVKPPLAWRGTPAEQLLDLDTIRERTVFYRGGAADAALKYPQNANVAATLALAGIGFEAMQVELIADPAAPGNLHEIEVEGAAGSFAIRLQGKPSKSNPKSSALTAFSVARALLNQSAVIVI